MMTPPSRPATLAALQDGRAGSGDRRWQISLNGGRCPRGSRAGSDLFHITGEVVPVAANAP